MKLIIIADPDEYVRSELKTKLQNINLEFIDLENGFEVWETLKKNITDNSRLYNHRNRDASKKWL
jgi:hypothetical protein